MFESILDPIFSPLLRLIPIIGIAIISLLISLIITIVYKYMTDQTMMKDLKMRQKDFQKKMKENKQNPEKLMKLQKEAMEVNMKYMTQSFKPTLITFLPIIIIFGWLNANIAYEPILPGQEFSVTLLFNQGYTGNVTLEEESLKQIGGESILKLVGDATQEINDGQAAFKFKGKEGNYNIILKYDEKVYEKDILITMEQKYASVQKLLKKDPVKSITLSNNKLIAINIFGKDEGGLLSGRVGWLGTYIIFSIIFSMALRKMLNIY